MKAKKDEASIEKGRTGSSLLKTYERQMTVSSDAFSKIVMEMK